jgi:glutamate-1-semialdehyde aminotransferase
VQTFDYDDLAKLAPALTEEVACVILEPVQFTEPSAGFLSELRGLCTAKGILLIFDEMWTGFRIALGGAQARYGVTADLACFSKAIANGMPLSVLTGRGDVMDLLSEEVFFFTTFGGEALSLAAAKATISELVEHAVADTLETRGAALRDGYNELTRRKGLSFTRAKGLGARTTIVFDAAVADPLEQKSLMQQELLRHGVLWSGFNNISYSHSPAELEHVLGAYARALDVLAQAVERGAVREALRGSPLQPVFRPTR